MNAGLYVGTISEEITSIIGYVPDEATSGYNLRAVRLSVSSALASGQDYWVVRLGTLDGSNFHALTEITLASGLSGIQRWKFAQPIRVPRGSVLGLRTIKRGSPDSIQGLSLVLEYGILGARSN